MLKLDKRRQKRDEHEAKDKELLQLWKEYRDTTTYRWAQEPVLLPKPIRDGYQRIFTLRDDIARRADVDTFKTLLKVYNSICYCRDQAFTYKSKKKGQKAKILPINQKPRELFPREFEKLIEDGTLKAQHLKFIRRQENWGKYGRLSDTFVFTHPHYFEYKVEPRFLTHYYPIDADKESQHQRVRNKIEQNNWWPRIDKLLMGSYKSWDEDFDDSKQARVAKEKFKNQVEDWMNEQIKFGDPISNPYHKYD